MINDKFIHNQFFYPINFRKRIIYRDPALRVKQLNQKYPECRFKKGLAIREFDNFDQFTFVPPRVCALLDKV
ncbi:hypothetical protein LCGC14_1595690 [marine sediment metagenome]|uniref:Uncharacterized protein n=1 Tax=marine sediment metagenome TaxID=412755 RepID=A0A0F9KTA1_9ZZZZ